MNTRFQQSKDTNHVELYLEVLKKLFLLCTRLYSRIIHSYKDVRSTGVGCVRIIMIKFQLDLLVLRLQPYTELATGGLVQQRAHHVLPLLAGVSRCDHGGELCAAAARLAQQRNRAHLRRRRAALSPLARWE